MMKVVKPVNKEMKAFQGFSRSLKGHLVLACLLPLLGAKGSYCFEPSPIWTPSDILTHFSLNGDGHLHIKEDTSFFYDKSPSFQLAIGQYRANRLNYLQLESKSTSQKSSVKLYSLGGGVRFGNNTHKFLPSKMIGGYIFLDTTLDEPSSVWHNINLCNLNIGVEALFTRHYHVAINAYIPLKPYNYGGQFTKKKLEDKTYKFQQPYYLESGNYGGDINLSKTFSLGKCKTKTSLGVYGFYDRSKELEIANIIPYAITSRVVLGITHKFLIDWNDTMSIYYKMTYDTAQRPWSVSFGLSWKHSTHNPIHTQHKNLWLTSIERRLAPVFASEEINTTKAAKDINSFWLAKCEILYKNEKYEGNNKSACELIQEADQNACKRQKILVESILNHPNEFKHISLFIHPDKGNILGDETIEAANSRYHIFKDNIFPTLYERTILSSSGKLSYLLPKSKKTIKGFLS